MDGVGQDRIAQEALGESLRRFEATFENAAVGIAHVAPDGRWLRVNQKICDVVGYTREELFARTVGDITHPDDLDADWEQARRVLAGEIATYSMDKRYLRKDGSAVWINLTVSLVRDAAGQPDYFISVVKDISDRKRAEEEARSARAEAERRASELDAVLEAMAESVTVYNAAGTIVRTNAAQRKVFGFDITGTTSEQQPALSRRLALRHPDGRPLDEDERPVMRTLRGQGHAGLTVVITRADGSDATLAVSTTPLVVGGEAAGAVSVAHDITELRNAEEQLRRRQAELAHASRLSIMGELAAELAHEINQPLQAIKNYAQGAIRRLLKKPEKDEDLLSALENVSSEAGRAAEIIRRIRRFVEKREPQDVRVRLNAVVESALSLSRSDLEQHHVKVTRELADGLPAVHGDPIQIEQVIVNLIRNAAEAMEETPQQDRALRVSTARDGADMVRVDIRDRGRGIRSEDMEKIFEPFFTTKPEGMGMGLAICRSIARLHGGRLWVTPNPDSGCAFHFVLPVREKK